MLSRAERAESMPVCGRSKARKVLKLGLTG